MKEGEFFGENPENKMRSASVICLENCEILMVNNLLHLVIIKKAIEFKKIRKMNFFLKTFFRAKPSTDISFIHNQV